jgi:hypothetical protein
MAIRNKTIRRLPANSRKLARMINELDSTLTRLKHFLPAVEEMEHDSHALYNRLSTYEKKAFAQQKEAELQAADKLSEQQEIPHTDGANPETDGPLFVLALMKPICKTCVKSCKDGANAEFPDSCTQYTPTEDKHEPVT